MISWPIKENRGRVLWGDIHNRWMQASPKQGHCHSRDATTYKQETGTVLYWYDQLVV